jgi:hypothetical protein
MPILKRYKLIPTASMATICLFLLLADTGTLDSDRLVSTLTENGFLIDFHDE